MLWTKTDACDSTSIRLGLKSIWAEKSDSFSVFRARALRLSIQHYSISPFRKPVAEGPKDEEAPLGAQPVRSALPAAPAPANTPVGAQENLKLC